MMMIIIIIMAINDALVMAARPASRSRLYAHNAYQISAESSNGWLSYWRFNKFSRHFCQGQPMSRQFSEMGEPKCISNVGRT